MKRWTKNVAQICDMEIIVTGDLHIDLLHGSSKADRLLPNMEAYQFCQLIDTARRVTSDSSTLIDHVYVTCPERMTKVSVLPVGISDHFAILTVYANKPNLRDDGQKVMRYRDQKSFNPDNFLACMLVSTSQKRSHVHRTALMWMYLMFKYQCVNHIKFLALL